MNIKQASEQSGVSAPNIRFYEKEGLLTPARRQGNDYRDYTAGDVRTLKLIRMLRMLDVPLPTIKAVLRGEQPLQQALQAQQTVLEQQAAQLAGAIRFCAELTQQAPQVDQLDVEEDAVKMEASITDDLGADSLDVADIVMSIEEEFDIEVPDDQLQNLKVVGDIVKYIEENA